MSTCASIGNSTYHFKVRPCTQTTATAVGLLDGETYILHYVVGGGCNQNPPVSVPVMKAGVPVELSNDNNPIHITEPGTYMLVSENVLSEHSIFIDDIEVCK